MLKNISVYRPMQPKSRKYPQMVTLIGHFGSVRRLFLIVSHSFDYTAISYRFMLTHMIDRHNSRAPRMVEFGGRPPLEKGNGKSGI